MNILPWSSLWPWRTLACIYKTALFHNPEEHTLQWYRVFEFTVNRFFFWHNGPPVGQVFLIHKVSRSHTTTHHNRRTPLDEWSACRRDLYLTTHNTHIRQTSMPPVGFEPTIWAGKRPQTQALDHVGHWDRHIESRHSNKCKVKNTK